MARLILIEILLFALPFVVFLGWLYFRKGAPDAGEPSLSSEAPNFWLAVIGLVFVIAGFFVFGSLTQDDPDGIYIPSRVEDGKIVPGRVVPRGEAGDR